MAGIEFGWLAKACFVLGLRGILPGLLLTRCSSRWLTTFRVVTLAKCLRPPSIELTVKSIAPDRVIRPLPLLTPVCFSMTFVASSSCDCVSCFLGTHLTLLVPIVLNVMVLPRCVPLYSFAATLDLAKMCFLSRWEQEGYIINPVICKSQAPIHINI
jgi:hypothetical protein